MSYSQPDNFNARLQKITVGHRSTSEHNAKSIPFLTSIDWNRLAADQRPIKRARGHPMSSGNINSLSHIYDMMDGQKSEIPLSFEQLMALHDELFVEASFIMLLRRPADPVGLSYYLKRLREGYCRASILHQLVHSPEIRPDWRNFLSLVATLDRFRRSRKLTGWRLALYDLELGITPSLRRARILQNGMGAQQQLLAQAIGRIETNGRSGMGSKNETQDNSAAPNMVSSAIRFEPTHPRHINDVRSFDLPDKIIASIDLLHI